MNAVTNPSISYKRPQHSFPIDLPRPPGYNSRLRPNEHAEAGGPNCGRGGYRIVKSLLSRELTIDGHTVSVQIYSSGNNDWILEIVDENQTSTVWDGTFETDGLAFAEFQRTVDEEGIRAVVGPIE